MPVIKGQPSVAALSAERRQALLEWLRNELDGPSVADGPLIYQIPLKQSDRFDVLVVWNEFGSLNSSDRTNLIREAFVGRDLNIAQALGVTYREAMEQDLLPYAVVPMTRAGEADPTEIRRAMVEEGAIATTGNNIELRFPTMEMAAEAHRHLTEKLPRGYWSVSQTIPNFG